MRILITGGAGFIGSNFVEQTMLRYPEAAITVLDALTYAGKLSNLDDLSKDFSFVHGDICDEALIQDLVRKCDLVVNFAAESHNDNSLANPALFFRTNVMGVVNLAKACVLNQVRLHHVSTDEVFGDLPLDSDDFFRADSPYRPSSPYSASKASSDHVVRSFCRSFGLQATISNCSNNFGIKQDWEKFIPHSIRRLEQGLPIQLYGNGGNIRDWIHVEDHCDGIWAVIENGEIGCTYLLGAQDLMRNLDVAHLLLQIYGLDHSYIEFVEDRPGHDRKYSLDVNHAASALGWKASRRPLQDSLKDVVPWYVNSLKLDTHG